MVRKLIVLFFLFQISFISSSQVDDLQREVDDFVKKELTSNVSSSLIDLSPISSKMVKSFLKKGKSVPVEQGFVILDMVIVYFKNNFSETIDKQIAQDMTIYNQLAKALDSKNNEAIKKMKDAGFLSMESDDYSSVLFSLEKVAIFGRLFAVRCHISQLFSSVLEEDKTALLLALKFMNSQSNGCCLDIGSYDRLEQSMAYLQEYFLRTNIICVVKKSLLSIDHNKEKIKIAEKIQKIEALETSERTGLEKSIHQQLIDMIKQCKKDLVKQKTAEDNKGRRPYFERWREAFDKKLIAYKANERHREYVEKVRLERTLLPEVLEAERTAAAVQVEESTLAAVTESGVKNTVANVQVLEERKARRLQRLEERERSKIIEFQKKFQAEERGRVIQENFMKNEPFYKKFKRYGFEKEQLQESCYCSNCAWYTGKSVRYLGSLHGDNFTENSSYFAPDCNESMCRHKSAIEKHCVCLDCTAYRKILEVAEEIRRRAKAAREHEEEVAEEIRRRAKAAREHEGNDKSRVIAENGSWRHNPYQPLPRLL